MSRHALALIGALLFAVCVLTSTAALTPTALAGPANAGLPGTRAGDPLRGLIWGNYSGSQDEVFPSYFSASGTEKALIGKVALRPRMRWFGWWYPNQDAYAAARQYIENVSGGRSDVLVQMAIMRVFPWEGQACTRLPTQAEQSSYRAWIDAFAAAIGSARVALVLQPDLPFEACVPGHSLIPMQEVAYAARAFSALAHTTVYIDAGAGDWPSVGEAVTLLREAGVRYTRGFALGATHYDSTENELRFGAKVVRALATAGVPGRHFVINTSSNGRGFTYQQYNDPRTFDNARVCRSKADRVCATLGIPPTTDVANRRWGLSPAARRLAARFCDAYLWIGRPWLDNQADPFDLARTLGLAATTPF